MPLEAWSNFVLEGYTEFETNVRLGGLKDGGVADGLLKGIDRYVLVDDVGRGLVTCNILLTITNELRMHELQI